MINKCLFVVETNDYIPMAEYYLSKKETFNDVIKVTCMQNYIENKGQYDGWIIIRDIQQKSNALVLDYAGNIAEHGAIDRVNVTYNPSTGKSETEKADHKICPVCETINEIDREECAECGYVLKEIRSVNHYEEPDDSDINYVVQEPQWYDVTSISYSRHKGKKGKSDTLKCEIMCFMNSYSEWICIEHEGYAYKKAIDTIKLRLKNPNDLEFILSEKLAWMDKVYNSKIDFFADNHIHILKPPTRIKVDLNEKYPRIIEYDYTPKEEEKEEIINW